jgi:3-(3-hydroxy-phenyl)propionate hydroxylase
MDHAEFQQMLLDGLARIPSVEVRHTTRLVEFTQDADGVVAQLEGPDGPEEVHAQFVVGADGGRSLVRRIIGEEPMRGSAFAERWLVLDTRNDAHDERFAMHHGDPDRPRVVVVGRDGRCRYEFLVHDDEHPEGDAALLAFARELVAPYRALDQADVVRCTIYQFYALVAERFRVGRALIAGDAAHMMPPFAGQGLNSGLRDAANLAWKVTAVLRGQAGLELLDSYGAERRPHVRAMVDLSVRMGAVMMTRSRARATARDLSFTVGQRLPLFRRFFREMRFKPPATYKSGLFVGHGEGGVVGSMLVQPWVLDDQGTLMRLDAVTGTGFALLGIEVDAAALGALSAGLWTRLEAPRIHVTLDDRLPRATAGAVAVADADGLLAEQLDALRGKVVLVRPDRYIAGAFGPADERTFAAALERGLGEPQPAAAAPLEAA